MITDNRDGHFSLFSKISSFLVRILMKYIEWKKRLEPKLQVNCKCFIRTRFRKRDIVVKPENEHPKLTRGSSYGAKSPMLHSSSDSEPTGSSTMAKRERVIRRRKIGSFCFLLVSFFEGD